MGSNVQHILVWYHAGATPQVPHKVPRSRTDILQCHYVPPIASQGCKYGHCQLEMGEIIIPTLLRSLVHIPHPKRVHPVETRPGHDQNAKSLHIHDVMFGNIVPPTHPDDKDFNTSLTVELVMLADGGNCDEVALEDGDVDLRTASNLVLSIYYPHHIPTQDNTGPYAYVEVGTHTPLPTPSTG